ncbi:MAG TPA: lipopolysaccharide biosynthesis protein [Thermoanaerobaculia bacterium]|nr:lipopolysaccharide biosynthesis protein [Thermoanaerobaculia bacterium]
MSFRAAAIRSVAWNAGGNVSRQLLQVGTLLVMARLLSPSEFGLYAIVMIFVSFFQVLGSLGTAQVVVHLDELGQTVLATVFWLSIATNAVIAVLLFVGAWPLAWFFEQESLRPVLQLMSAAFIIGGLIFVQKALLEREMQFRRLATIETLSFGIGAAAGIVAALRGAGVFSLVVMTLVNDTVLALGLWATSRWRPTFEFSAKELSRILAYTSSLTGFNIINLFARQADTFLIGKFLGSTMLGVYDIGYRIMLYPLDSVSRVAVRVAFPIFSRLKAENIRFKNGYVKTIRLISMISFPVMAGLWAVSDSLIIVTLGDQWVRLPPLLRILAPVGAIQSIVTTLGVIYTAKGSTGKMLRIGSVNAIVSVASFLIGLPFGIEGVARSYAVANVVMLYPNLRYAWTQIGLGVGEGMRSLWSATWASVVMAASVYWLGIELVGWGWRPEVALLCQVVTGVVVYGAIALATFRDLIVSVASGLRER